MKRNGKKMSRTSNIESDNSQNGGLEDYNYISDGKRRLLKYLKKSNYYCSLHGLNQAMATVRPWETRPQPGPKNLVPRNLVLKKLVEKNLSQNIWSQIFFSKKMVPKKFAPKNLVPKNLVQKKLAPKKFVPKKLNQKMLVPKKLFLFWLLLSIVF